MEGPEEQPPPLPDAESLAPSPPRWPATIVVAMCWLLAFIFAMMLGTLVVITTDEGESIALIEGYPIMFLAFIGFITFGMVAIQILIAFRTFHIPLRTYVSCSAAFCAAVGVVSMAGVWMLSPAPADERISPVRLGELASYITCPLFALGGVVWLVGIIVKWK